MQQKKNSGNVLPIEVKRTQILGNKTGYLGLKVLKTSKLAICEFRYDYMKPKYGEKAKLYYMDTDSFIVCIKTEDIYVLKNILKQDLIL